MNRKKEDGKATRWGVYYLYLLLVWGVFRLFFKLPVLLDELWFKPILWLLPLYYVWYREGRRVKLFSGNPMKAALWGLGLGVVYLVMINLVKFSKSGMEELHLTRWDLVGVGIATAITEEIVFSGYLFSKIMERVKDLWVGMVVEGLLFAAIHVPIGIFIYRYGSGELLGFLVVVAMTAAANGFLMYRTKNVIAPIIAHSLWTMAVLWGR